VTHRPRPPLQAGWVIVDGLPLYHRSSVPAGGEGAALVHVHGFGISGTYLEPTAALLAQRHRCYVPDLPGMGRSLRPTRPLDLPGLARALVHYCDAVGVERATFVGNSLGCPLICEVAASFPDRIDGAVLVSPAGGPSNLPVPRAVLQMALDGPREPLGLIPIAVRDYLRFGPWRGLQLFRAMTAFPTLERVRYLQVPTLVVAGSRDPLVRVERAHVFSGLPHVQAVRVPGAHALNFSRPDMIAALIEAHLAGEPLQATGGPYGPIELIDIPDQSPR
jgi:pimeloyl-ACP methyl ester carboxylesterase